MPYKSPRQFERCETEFMSLKLRYISSNQLRVLGVYMACNYMLACLYAAATHPSQRATWNVLPTQSLSKSYLTM